MALIKGAGNWKVGNMRLPELGISEKFGGNSRSVSNAKNRQAISIWQNSNSKSKSNPKANVQKKGDVSFDVGEKETLRSGGTVASAMDYRGTAPASNSSGGTTTNSTSGGSSGGDNNDGGGRSLSDIINEEFDSVMAGLDAQASSAQNSIIPQREVLGTAYQNNLNDAGLRQSNEQAALKSALNDYTQRGIARSSLTGGFGSSAGEALAERLGRYGMQEQSKLQNGYATMRNKLAQSYQSGLADLEAQLQQRLSNIDTLKASARSDKARATYDAWSNYMNQVAQFNNSMAQYDAALRQVVAERSGNLGGLVNNTPNFFNPKNFGVMSPVDPVQEIQPLTIGQGIPATMYSDNNEEDAYSALLNLPQTVQ